MIARLLLLVALVAGAGYAATHNPSGTVAFGASFNTDTQTISDPATSFGPRQQIAWVAHFSTRPGTTQLTRTIAQVMPGRPDTPIASVAIGIAQPDAPGVYAERNVAEWEQALRVGAGTYRLRYLNGATVLAEGMFTLTN